MEIFSLDGQPIHDGDELVWVGRPDITGVVESINGKQGVKWSTNTEWYPHLPGWNRKFTIIKKGNPPDYQEVGW